MSSSCWLSVGSGLALALTSVSLMVYPKPCKIGYMFVVMNRFFVNPAHAGQFEARIRNRPGQVEQQPGFVRVQLLRPDDLADPYIVLTLWQSKADFEAWVKTDTFTEKHAGKRTLSKEVFFAPNEVETFEVILDTQISD